MIPIIIFLRPFVNEMAHVRVTKDQSITDTSITHMRLFTVYSSCIFCENLYEIFKITGYAVVTIKKGVDYMDMIL